MPNTWLSSFSTSSNLLNDNFSPIVAVLSIIIFSIVLPSTSNFITSSTVFTLLLKIAVAIKSTNPVNSGFLATKSVSEFTSTITALFPSTLALANPSAAILVCFLAALEIPFSLSQVIASSILPFVSVRAFLQSSIPAPVASLNSFTIFAVIIVFLLILNFQLILLFSFLNSLWFLFS